MSTLSSKPIKRSTLIESVSIVVFLILALSILLTPMVADSAGPLNVHTDRFAILSSMSNVIFAADLEYWNTNCSHGWSSDSTCSDIVARTQSCAGNVDSGYCAEYAYYLKRLAK